MRSDHDPSAVRRGLLRGAGAYLGQGLLSSLAWLPSRHRPVRARDIHTLVFVHGLAGNRANFYPLQTWLAWQGFDRQYSYNYKSAGSIEGLGVELGRRLDRDIKGGRITIVAHSMGGLVSRVYLQMLGGERRVDTLITLCTPHQGSHAAAWLPTALVSQLEPEGPFLEHLNALPAPERTRVVAFAASEDKLVLPPRYAFPAFGEHRMLEGRGHLDVLFSRDMYRQVREVLAEQEVAVRRTQDFEARRTG